MVSPTMMNANDACEAVAVYGSYRPIEAHPSASPVMYGCSGILWRHAGQLWGITHGSILFPIVEEGTENNLVEFRKSLMNLNVTSPGKRIRDRFHIHVLREKNASYSARIATVLTSPYLETGLKIFLNSGWSFNEMEETEKSKMLFSMFVVFFPTGQINACRPELINKALTSLVKTVHKGGIHRGSPVLTISSPFAGTCVSIKNPQTSAKTSNTNPRLTRNVSDEKEDRNDKSRDFVPIPSKSTLSDRTISNFQQDIPILPDHTPFLNSWSEGVVSGLSGPSEIIILTDASSTLGSEGGPVFLASHENGLPLQLVGILVQTICSWRGEWVGFSLACNLETMLKDCLGYSEAIRELGMFQDSRKGELFQKVASTPIVQIKCGPARGSGIPINGKLGYILTCAHVVEKFAFGITVTWIETPSKIRSVNAKLLYKTPPGKAYDVALISVGPGTGLPTTPISKISPVRGERVWAVGYALHIGNHMESSKTPEYPLLSRGIIASVIPGEFPSLLQTTCSVQSGGSGGAIIREADGSILGLIVCNTAMDILAEESNKSESVIFPHINIAVPIITLNSSLEKFCNTMNYSYLREWESPDEKVQRIWRLQSPEFKPAKKSKL